MTSRNDSGLVVMMRTAAKSVFVFFLGWVVLAGAFIATELVDLPGSGPLSDALFYVLNMVVIATAFVPLVGRRRTRLIPHRCVDRPMGPAAYVRLLSGPRAFKRIFGQIIADAHEEWLEAANAGDEQTMLAVKIRTPLHLLAAALTYPLAWFARQVDALRKISGGGRD